MSERPARRKTGDGMKVGDFELMTDNFGDTEVMCQACREWWPLRGIIDVAELGQIIDVAELVQQCVLHGCDDPA